MRDVPEKAHHVLNIILLAFLLIAMRVWYLSIVKHDEHKELALKPKQKTVIETPNRGTIRDRFNIPLAVNKIQYNASILFEPIRNLPRTRWETDPSGKRKKVYLRKEYITKLSSFLGTALELDPIHIEDLIYSKISLFPNTPFILKENLSEEIYYRLHIQERNWPGLIMQISSKRHYPKNFLASNILGYMGNISEKEFLSLQGEINALEQFLKDRSLGFPAILPKGYTSIKEIKERHQELKNKSYTLQSKVGKSGIEGRFDDQLRGISGKKKYEIDVHGTPLHELPESYPATPGRRFILTLSSELQEFAEELLIESELMRHQRFPTAVKDNNKFFSPWIKGGAIVAMIPQTGEIVACASYPRFNPNDFSLKSPSLIIKCLETPAYIGQLWDGLKPLEREFGGFSKSETIREELPLSLDLYLDMILSTKSSVKKALNEIANLQTAIYLQNAVQTLFTLSEELHIHPLIDTLFPPEKGHTPSLFKTSKEAQHLLLEKLCQKTTLLDELKQEISHYLAPVRENDDKILVLDLIRLIAPSHLFDDALLMQTGRESLSAYREFNQAVMRVQNDIKKIAKEAFHKNEFAKWRQEYFADYLKQKREAEKEANTYEHPYLDYLTEIEDLLFENFFGQHRFEFLSAFILNDNTPSTTTLKNHLLTLDREFVIPYLKTMRSYQELNRPLWGRYYFPAKAGKSATEQNLARHFYPSPGFGYAKSFAFQENCTLGSIFKIVTGYEALRQHYLKNNDKPFFTLNPLTIIDQSPSYSEKLTRSSILGYTALGVPITRYYKGGTLPRGHLNVGKIDLRGALERTSNIYFSLLASDVIENPSDLTNTAKMLSFGKKTGIDLPGEVKGSVPNDVSGNPTALYALAIGQHSLTATPLQTAVCLSTFANGGNVLKPQIVKTIANWEPSECLEDFFSKKTFLYRDYLNSVGIYFPLFTEAQDKDPSPFLWSSSPEILSEIYLPPDIRHFLLEGLYDVVNGARGTARPATIKTFLEKPFLRKDYEEIRPTFSGKTSTAEFLYRPFLDREQAPVICNYAWFGGIALADKDTFDSDLVVIVCLRFGDYGKEAALLAARIVKKWRDLNKKN